MEWLQSLMGRGRNNYQMKPNDGPQAQLSLDDQYRQSQIDYMNTMTRQNQTGFNLNTANNVIGGLSSLGQLYGSWQGLKLAKDQWKTQKSVLTTNMMNQIKSYNNSLRDRLDTRAHMEGRSQESADRQYEERKAVRH